MNKPCMSSRRMSLLPRVTLHSDSEQVHTFVDFLLFIKHSSEELALYIHIYIVDAAVVL